MAKIMAGVSLLLKTRTFLFIQIPHDIMRAKDRPTLTLCIEVVVDAHHSKGVNVHRHLAGLLGAGPAT